MAGKTNYGSLGKPQTLGKVQGKTLPQEEGLKSFGSKTAGNAPAQTSLTSVSPSVGMAKKDSTRPVGATDYAPPGGIKLGEPKIYESAGSYGSGFVNLSHLLGLNKSSGAKSAMDLANRTAEAGKSAQAGIGGIEDKFKKEAEAGSTIYSGPTPFTDPGATPGQIAEANAKADKAAKGYTGPESLDQVGGYADLAKKVSDAEQMAKNTQSGYGIAAQVNKETGLSPVQSAASAFYMGVNNPNLKRAGSAFTGLGAALQDANNRAMSAARDYRTATSNSVQGFRDDAAAQQKALDDFNTTAANTTTGAQRVAAAENNARDRQDAISRNHGGRTGESEIKATDDVLWAIKQGMPSELAYMGVSYDQWVAAGKPSYEEWLSKGG